MSGFLGCQPTLKTRTARPREGARGAGVLHRVGGVAGGGLGRGQGREPDKLRPRPLAARPGFPPRLGQWGGSATSSALTPTRPFLRGCVPPALSQPCLLLPQVIQQGNLQKEPEKY
ncbi:hypothetical protein HispidOSU_004863 [Sigmodon hispidus]